VSAFWIVHNPRAGQPGYARQVERAADALARRGLAVRLERPCDFDAMRQAAAAAVADGAAALLVAGGDGTVGTLAGELAGTRVALGVLPAGTANVWARTLGLPRPWPWRPQGLVEAALQQAEAPARLTDLGRCNGAPFLVWAGVGFDAYVTVYFERQRAVARRVGGFFYNMGLTLAVAQAWHAVPMRAHLTGPGGVRELSGPQLMVTVGNTGWHGGGLVQLSPAARLDDGLLEVWAFAGRYPRDMLAHAGRALRGAAFQHPAAVRAQVERVTLTLAAPQPYHLDAEPQPGVEQLVITVEPRVLRVLVPPKAASLYAGAA
jgi:diacylglycerol kinase family enzyme